MQLKKRILRLLIWMFERTYPIDFMRIDRTAVAQWLWDSHRRKGAEEYYRMRSYILLKTMGGGLEKEQYWINVGRRLELMTLYDEMKKVAEIKQKGKDNAKLDDSPDKAEGPGDV